MDAEIELQKKLEKIGMLVIRSSGSKGPIDVVGLYKDFLLPAQVKATSKDSVYVRGDLKALNEVEKNQNIRTYLAVKFTKDGVWVFCPIKKLVDDNATTVSRDTRGCKEVFI
jgi:Holliday junction resolvase